MIGNNSMRYIVFGTGGVGIECKELLVRKGKDVIAFADNDSSKHGTVISGLKVYSPSKIKELDPDMVAIGMYKAAASVKRQLLELGIPDNKICIPIEPDRIYYNDSIQYDPRDPAEEALLSSTSEFHKKRQPLYDNDFIDKLNNLKDVLKANNISLWNVCVCGGGILQAYGLRKSKQFDDIDIILTSNYRNLFGEGLVIVSETAEMHRQNEYDIEDDEIILNPEFHFIFQGLKFVNLDIYYRYLQKKGIVDEIDLVKHLFE